MPKHWQTYVLRQVIAPLTNLFLSQQATIGKLSDKVLLNIFRYFLDDSPRHWPRLVHTCRKWRRVVFASHRALQLLLFCTHGTSIDSVQKALHCWPAFLPVHVAVEYGGSPGLDPPAPEDENNIMTLLKYSNRVTSISLTITSSLLEKLTAIERPLSELENLSLLSRVSELVTLPRTFWWRPRLSCLHLTRIAFPAFLPLLYTSGNLVDLQLHEVPGPWPIPVDQFVRVLSGMAQLRTLSLHLLSTADAFSSSSDSSLKLPRKRVILRVLNRLSFRGTTKYLEDMVEIIDAPRLGDIEIASSDDTIFDLSNLSQLIDRVELHRSHHRAHISSSEGDISISFIQTGAPTCFVLKLLCNSLWAQLSSMSRIRAHFPALVLNVEDLRIDVTRQSREEERHYGGAWLKLIASFASVKWFHASEDFLTLSLHDLQSLRTRHLARHGPVLPVLHKLYISQPGPPHAPLMDDIVSFMISRQLSGHPIVVEYENPYNFKELIKKISETSTMYARSPSLPTNLLGVGVVGPFPPSQEVTIEILPEDVLLDIFRHYLGANPHTWHMLGWVCQRWRQIVFTSPLGLNLRIHCTYGKPVLESLDYWPALPIILRYGGILNLGCPSPSDEDNIVAALRYSDRVRIISLTITSTLLEKLSAMGALEPFSELEELCLLPRDTQQQLTLPSAFRWGPRLRTLHLARIAFPSFPQLLSHSQGLVELKLCEIPIAGYFPPESFANALSGTTQLETHSLHFISLPPRRSHFQLPPQSGERVTLPSLTSLKYRGTSKYLDSFVARVNAPHLADIDITFFSQPTMDASQLGLLIGRIEVQTSSLSRADIETSAHAISISFTNLSASVAPLKLQILCKQLDWQLSCMAQVCDQFSPFLFRVEELSVSTTQSSSVQGEQWLDLVRSFSGARDLRVGDKLTGDIICALGHADAGESNLLPSLRLLHIEQPVEMNAPSWDALLSFINSRSLCGRQAPVQVNVPLIQCHICHTSFLQEKALEQHLKTSMRASTESWCAPIAPTSSGTRTQG